VSFRVADGLPELWDPASGGIAGSAWFTQRNGRTEMPVSLDGSGSTFVVFRKSGREVSVDEVLRDGAKLTPSDLIVLREGDGIKALVSENGQYSLRFTDGSEKSFAVIDVPGPVVVKSGIEKEISLR
jgi:hypothetical protein